MRRRKNAANKIYYVDEKVSIRLEGIITFCKKRAQKMREPKMNGSARWTNRDDVDKHINPFTLKPINLI